MNQWLLYKLFRLVVVLFVVSLFTFHLCKSTPGTPATLQLDELKNSAHRHLSAKQLEAINQALKKQSALNKPLFYIGFGTLASPDTLYKSCRLEHLPMIERWIANHGNWPQIESYYHSLLILEQQLGTYPGGELINQKLFTSKHLAEAEATLSDLLSNSFPDGIQYHARISLTLIEKIKQHSTPFKSYLPSIYWHGTNNTYHQYIAGILSGNFGYSIQKHRPVIFLVTNALKWSLITGLSALILTYLLAIPLGVYTATYPFSLLTRLTNTLFYIAYSLPVYWVATILIIFVASSEYLDWFPAFGTGDVDDNATWLEKFTVTAYHLVLPVLCWTYGGVAYLSRQVQASMHEELSKDYIITAKAKGISEQRIIWRHAFVNSLLPAITLLGLILPGLIGGAVVIESIFSIPGMGKLAIEALQARDYPVLYMITLLTGFVSVLGLFLSDILASKLFPTLNSHPRA